MRLRIYLLVFFAVILSISSVSAQNKLNITYDPAQVTLDGKSLTVPLSIKNWGPDEYDFVTLKAEIDGKDVAYSFSQNNFVAIMPYERIDLELIVLGYDSGRGDLLKIRMISESPEFQQEIRFYTENPFLVPEQTISPRKEEGLLDATILLLAAILVVLVLYLLVEIELFKRDII